MKLETANRRVSAAALISIVALSACSKDKTLDEWRRERTAEEVAKIESVSGVYSGQVDETGEPVTIELRSSTRITSQVAGASAERQGTLTGRILIGGESFGLLTFDQGFYDVDSHDFKLEIPIRERGGSDVVIDVYGNAAGGGVSGRIEARGFPEKSKSFRLVRGTAISSSTVRASGAKNDGGVGSSVTQLVSYSGNVLDKRGVSRPASLVLMSPKTTAEQIFLTRFTAIDWVDVTFTVEGASFFVSNAQWDHRRGILMGERVNQAVPEATSIIIECEETGDSSSDLNCRYILNRVGVLYSGRFKRGEQ